jgi:hypothetical protein
MLAAALFLAASSPFAQTDIVQTTTQKWTAGWDNLAEPLNLVSSNVMWSVSAARKMTVTFNLVGATPNKLYQVGVHIFCTTVPGTFGQFPTNPPSGACFALTRQGKSGAVASVEMGVVTTDMRGKGSFKVVVGPIASGSYDLEFTVRDGAGCNLIGGAGSSACPADFQSPGPFKTTTTVVVP